MAGVERRGRSATVRPGVAGGVLVGVERTGLVSKLPGKTGRQFKKQMNKNELLRRFPKACASFIKANASITSDCSTHQKIINEVNSVIVKPSKDVMKLNSLEAAYYRYLQDVEAGNVFDWIGVQNITLKIGDDCRYTPDFFTLCRGELQAREVKGFFRDDAKVKLKVAARMFPWISFILITRKQGQWNHLEVAP